MLAPVILALDDDACRHMGQPDCGVCFVDVLATGSGCTIGIDPYISRIDIDLDGIVYFGIDKKTAKRRVATVCRVKWRFPDQPVNTGFGAQVSVGIIAFDLDGGCLDSGDFSVGLFQNRRIESFAFAIAQILAENHGCPVLGFGTACARLDVNEAVAWVHRIGKHSAEFQFLDLALQFQYIGFDRFQGFVILFFFCHIEQFAGIR